jgi:hypothetical protein
MCPPCKATSNIQTTSSNRREPATHIQNKQPACVHAGHYHLQVPRNKPTLPNATYSTILLSLPSPKLPDATPASAGAVASETLLTIITALAAFLLGAAGLQVLSVPALRAGVGTTAAAPDVDRQRGRSLLGAAPAAAEAREHASVHHAVAAAAAHAGLAVEDVEPAGRAAGRHAQLAVRRRLLLLLLLERRQGRVRVHHRRPRAHHRLRAHHLSRLRRHVPRSRIHHQV